MSSKMYHISLNGKVYEVEIEEVQPGQAPKQTTQPATPVAPTPQPVAKGAGEEVKAPMPGVIFNILVKEGQTVKKGEVIAVLEAMKMENEIVSPVDGQISAINVTKGQNVNAGDLILSIA